MKIVHMADIHCRPYKYLDEMEYTFRVTYEKLDEIKPDLVVICGDTFHSKLTVSNEYFKMAVDFFRELSERCPVVVIAGNHDLALSNKDRLDAISPIIYALHHTKHKITYLKHSTDFFEFQNFRFDCFAIIDEKAKWPRLNKKNKDKINIALYHGTVEGSLVDSGWTSRGNKDDISLFSNYDFAFLGDIHMAQFFPLNGVENKAAYPGSLRQNNFGETIDKGFLLWNIESKTDFTVERIILPQKRYFFTLYASCVADIQEIGELPEDCRIRVQLTKEVDGAEQLKIKSEIENTFKPHNEVILLPPQIDEIETNIKLGGIDVLHQNIRHQDVQVKLIKEYIKHKFESLSQDEIDDILKLDKIYHSHADTDIERNVEYEIKELQWSNLFAYGRSNKINFDKLSGIVGVFGPNMIGKSSIIDILCWAQFNQIQKEGANKYIDFINKRSKNADVKLTIGMNNKTYHIHRQAKKSKDETKSSADIDFKENELSLNGETKPDTNKFIRDKFGTEEDFAFTSLCAQFSLTRFVDSRGTKRKEVLAKYYDLDIFDQKYELAKKDFDVLKLDGLKFDFKKKTNELQELKGKDCREEISKISTEIDIDKLEIGGYEYKIEELIHSKKHIEENVRDESDKIRSIRQLIQELSSEIEKSESSLERHLHDLKTLGFEKTEIDEGEKLDIVLVTLEEDIKKLENTKEMIVKQLPLLDTIPNVPECKACPLVKDIFHSKNELVTIQDNLINLTQKQEEIVPKLKKINQRQYQQELAQRAIDWANSEISKRKMSKQYNMLLLEGAEKNHQKWLQNKENIIKNKDIETKISQEKNKLKQVKESLETSKKKQANLLFEQKNVEKSIEKLENELEEHAQLSYQLKIYELYLEIMGKNGLSYWIIGQKLSILNKYVNFILSQVTDFKLDIENNEEEKSIKIFIVDGKGKRPVELGSGAEKTISSIALRAALWKVCALPKTSMLIFDEAASYLDSEKNDAIIKLFNYLKTQFKKILIITHDETLKSIVDYTIYINSSNGFSKVETV